MYRIIDFIINIFIWAFEIVRWGAAFTLIVVFPLFALYMMLHVIFSGDACRGSYEPDPQEQYNP